MEMRLTTPEREELRKLQRNLCGSSDYARVTCILMLDNGYPHSAIPDCLRIDISTVYRYRSSYLHGGAGELLENPHKGYWGLLDSHQISALRKELREHVYTNSKSVARWIFTGELSDILANMQEGTVVYYADGVHPTHNSHSTYAWIEKGERQEQPTVSGCDRVNINGLLNAHDVTDVIDLDCESVNAESTKELYQKALERHPDAPEIYIISDNARYFHNKGLKEWTEDTRIRQIFFPPYSPNLNLIERLWKFLRKKVINTGFYRTKEEFRQATRRFFDNIALFRDELESLQTLKSRLANSQNISFGL